MPLDLFPAGALRALIEVAAFSLLGQGLLKRHLCGLHGVCVLKRWASDTV